MNYPFNRIMTTALACLLTAGLAMAGCGGEGGGENGDHGGEPAEHEAPDPNTDARQEHMREIARLCVGIAAAVENNSLGSISADVTHLKEIMEEVSTMPPRYDSSRYGFYASDFQIRAETLIAAAETGSAIEADSAMQALTITCGVCHYNCKFPADP